MGGEGGISISEGLRIVVLIEVEAGGEAIDGGLVGTDRVPAVGA